MPWPVRLELIPTHAEGVLGIDVIMPPEKGVKTEKPPLNSMKLNTLGIQSLTGLSEQWTIHNWMTNTTLSMSA